MQKIIERWDFTQQSNNLLIICEDDQKVQDNWMMQLIITFWSVKIKDKKIIERWNWVSPFDHLWRWPQSWSPGLEDWGLVEGWRARGPVVSAKPSSLYPTFVRVIQPFFKLLSFSWGLFQPASVVTKPSFTSSSTFFWVT